MSGLRLLIVAVHDVAPPFQSAVQDICEVLGHIGVSRRVLKVVANRFGAHPLDKAPDLVALVRAAHDRGDQLILHGWEQRVHGVLRGGMVKFLRGAVFAPLVAEFLTLDAEESAVAVERGLLFSMQPDCRVRRRSALLAG